MAISDSGREIDLDKESYENIIQDKIIISMSDPYAALFLSLFLKLKCRLDSKKPLWLGIQVPQQLHLYLS